MIRLDTSKIKLSEKDKFFGVRLPTVLDSKLAYETGVSIGDGSLCIVQDGDSLRYMINYSGNLQTELIYYEKVLKPLIESLYGKTVKVEQRRKNECRIQFTSKTIFLFKTSVLTLPVGKKYNITIPQIILQEKKLLLSCLRGIFDTDFSLVFLKKHKDVAYYPKLRLVSISKPLIQQLEKIIKRELNLNPVTEYDIRRFDPRTKKVYVSNALELNGKRSLEIWMEKVGSNNFINLAKFSLWKAFGYLPKTSLKENINFLQHAPVA